VITSGEFRLKTATDTYLDQPGGGMPQIPRGVTALPYLAAIAVLAAIAAAVAAAAALTTVRRDVT